VDQELGPLAAFVEIHQQVASLLSIQAPPGLLVQAMYSIRRLPIQMKTSTYSRRSKTVAAGEEIAGERRRGVLAQGTSASPAGTWLGSALLSLWSEG
jgi:hypothetical protein